MKKNDLIKTAARLKQPNEKSLNEFTQKSEKLAAMINESFAQRPDLAQLIGAENIEMMKDNHRNHIRFMASLFSHHDAEVLVDTVLWVFRAYRSHGFRLTYWPAQLDAWVELFKSNLSESTFHEIYPFYHWMIINNPAFAQLSDASLE